VVASAKKSLMLAGQYRLSVMALALCLFVIPTRGEFYRLRMAGSGEMVSVDSVRFDDSTAYFRLLPERLKTSLPLREVSSIKRDAGDATSRGLLLGELLTVAAMGAVLYARGADETVSGGFLIGGLFLIPVGGLVGALVGMVAGSHTLYLAENPDVGRQDRKLRTLEPHADVPKASLAADALQDIPAKTFEPSVDSGKHLPVPRPDYVDLRPVLQKQHQADSILYRSLVHKNRLSVSSGAGVPSYQEFYRLDYSRILFSRRGSSLMVGANWTHRRYRQEFGPDETLGDAFGIHIGSYRDIRWGWSRHLTFELAIPFMLQMGMGAEYHIRGPLYGFGDAFLLNTGNFGGGARLGLSAGF
jgi:hypothetical protein